VLVNIPQKKRENSHFFVTYSLDFLHNLDTTRAMTDPGAILGVEDDPEKISDQVLFAVPQIIAPKPKMRRFA